MGSKRVDFRVPVGAAERQAPDERSDQMAWRKEFDPPLLDPERVHEIRQAYVDALAAIDAGEDFQPLLSRLYELTQREVSVQWLLAAAGSTSDEVAAELLARPDPPRIPSVTRDELVALVNKLLCPEITESEEDWWMGVLSRNVTHPRVLSLIYGGEKTAEQIVEEALAYRPFIMSAGEGPGRPPWSVKSVPRR